MSEDFKDPRDFLKDFKFHEYIPKYPAEKRNQINLLLVGRYDDAKRIMRSDKFSNVNYRWVGEPHHIPGLHPKEWAYLRVGAPHEYYFKIIEYLDALGFARWENYDNG